MKFLLTFAFLMISNLACAHLQAVTPPSDAMTCLKGSNGTTVVDSEIDACLKSDGVRFEVHGVSVDDQTAVITYRDPANFFIYRHYSLITKDTKLKSAIFALHRHDVVIVKGSLAHLHAPQQHVLATTLTVETASTVEAGMPDYKYETPPDEVLNKTNLTAVVHGVFEGGSILVIEYGDRVLPVYVEPRYVDATKNLYRSDVIEINYVIQDTPDRPYHLNLTGIVNGKPVQPCVVKQSILAQSGKPIDLTGELVLYPKSQQIAFNIFALKQDLGNNLRRYYTLVNFTDPQVFQAIRAKLQAAWDAEPNFRVNDRNKWLSTKLKVHAHGISNTQDPNQANPQILLNAVTDVEVIP